MRADPRDGIEIVRSDDLANSKFDKGTIVLVSEDTRFRDGRLCVADERIIAAMVNKEEIVPLPEPIAKAMNEHLDTDLKPSAPRIVWEEMEEGAAMVALLDRLDLPSSLLNKVRTLRVDQKRSYRAVMAGLDEDLGFASEKWVNQLVGQHLCARAALFFGEDPAREPWN